MTLPKFQRVALKSTLLLFLTLGSAPLSASYFPDSDDEENVVNTPRKQTSPKEEAQPSSVRRFITWLFSPSQPQKRSGQDEEGVADANEVLTTSESQKKKEGRSSRRLSFSGEESSDDKRGNLEQTSSTPVTTPVKEQEKEKGGPRTPLIDVEDAQNNEVGAPSTPVSIYPELPKFSPENSGQGDVVDEHKTPSPSKKQKSDEELEEEGQKKIQADREFLLQEKEEDLDLTIGGIPLFSGVSYDYQIGDKPVRTLKSGSTVKGIYKRCTKEDTRKAFKIIKAEREGRRLFGL
jgi:hypothetical protein